VFFVIPDPTTLIARATMSARSIVRDLLPLPEQKAAAEQVIANMGAAKDLRRSIVTSRAGVKVLMAEVTIRNISAKSCAALIAAFVVKAESRKNFRKHFLGN